MTQITLTYEEAKALLERAVAEVGETYVYQPPQTGGEFSYAACSYFDPQTQGPSCIVGHVLAYKGVTYDDARDWNCGVNAESLASEMGVIACDGATSDLLELAQSHQDTGKAWGLSLQLALEGEE